MHLLICTFGAVPRKGKGQKWVAFGVDVKDGRDWMTAAKNVGMWHRGVERGAETLDNAWRRADLLRQSNVRRQRVASGFFCTVVSCAILFLKKNLNACRPSEYPPVRGIIIIIIITSEASY